MGYLGCFVAAIVGILAVALVISLAFVIIKALLTSWLGILAAVCFVGAIIFVLLMR